MLRPSAFLLSSTACLVLALAAGCHASPAAVPASSPLAPLEDSYQSLRYWNDQIGVTEARRATQSVHQVSVAVMKQKRDSARAVFQTRLAAVPIALPSDDSLALKVIRESSRSLLRSGSDSSSGKDTAGSCDYSPDSIARQPEGAERLAARVLSCYGKATDSIEVDGEWLNRLEILGRLGRTDDPAKRERLFLALQPVWRSINGQDDSLSPYRILARLYHEQLKGKPSPIAQKATAFGASSAEMEGWLVRILETWHSISPDSTIEPWNFYYQAGAASRRLSPKVPALTDMRRVNDRYYHMLGADPVALGVHYDLEARPGKYPVAYTDFGARPRQINGRWNSGELWVFTSYLAGSFDNLAELLHETGHAIHIAAIRTRPAFMDWPDNDTFTEALADFPAMELYEPAWQMRFLGDSATLAESLRAKYAGIVFDVAWGLFELRMDRDPGLDPNQVWTDITSRYFRIRSHPEWSWWAMRGQLIDGPGYLVNYAIGAIITADLRARMQALRGPFVTSDTTWYSWVSEQLYRYGLERPSLTVLEGFLGRPLSPEAILADMKRARE
jgi:hypothetical protein